MGGVLQQQLVAEGLYRVVCERRRNALVLFPVTQTTWIEVQSPLFQAVWPKVSPLTSLSFGSAVGDGWFHCGSLEFLRAGICVLTQALHSILRGPLAYGNLK